MKKVLIGIVIFPLGLLIMEMIINYIRRDSPNLAELTVDSLYNSPAVSSKLGEFTGADFRIDSISEKTKIHYFTGKIGGKLNDTTIQGNIGRVGDKWKIIKLKGFNE